MSLSRLLLRLLLVALVGAGAAQCWVQRQADEVAQRLAAQWSAYGQLRYERVWVWLWGAGELRGLSFEPSGLTQALLGTPWGYRLTVERLRFARPRFDTQGRPTGVSLRFEGLQLPMQDAYRLRGSQTPPALARLGYAALDFDGELELRLAAESRRLQLDGEVRGRDFADFGFSLQLQTTLEQLRLAPDRAGLRRLYLDIDDRGLMPRYRDYWARREQRTPEATVARLLAELDARARRERWRWDAESEAALRGFVQAGEPLSVRLDPPDDVVLRDLPLYRVGDWPRLLGLRLAKRKPAAEARPVGTTDAGPAPGAGGGVQTASTPDSPVRMRTVWPRS